MPGYSVSVVDGEGREVRKREIGNIVIKVPLPPGCLPTLWNNDEGFVSSYLTDFPGFYKTADAGFEDEDGYFWIMTRTDDVINVAGHRLSTGEMEEVLAAHPDVAECAVVGVHDPLKGQVPFGFLVLKSGVTRADVDIDRRDCRHGARSNRPGRSLQGGDGCRSAAEDAVRKGSAGHHAADCRRPARTRCRRPLTIPRFSTRSRRRFNAADMDVPDRQRSVSVLERDRAFSAASVAVA